MDKTFVRTTVCTPLIGGGGGGGGYSLFWPIRGCVARLGGSPRSQILSRSVGTGRREPWERGWDRVWILTSLSRETAYIISSESVLNRINNFV